MAFCWQTLDVYFRLFYYSIKKNSSPAKRIEVKLIFLSNISFIFGTRVGKKTTEGLKSVSIFAWKSFLFILEY